MVLMVRILRGEILGRVELRPKGEVVESFVTRQRR